MRHLLAITLLALLATQSHAQPAVADFKDRPAIENALLNERLQTLLPALMREAGIDMWLVIAREYNDDPVFLSLVPKPRFTARRTTMLVFHDRGEANGIERLTVSRYPLGDTYQAVWDGGDSDSQWSRLAEVIAERDPQRIGINVSDTWPVADGLSHSLHERLTAALGETLSNKLVSAEALAVRWIETRTAGEVEVWQRAVAIARATIAEAFSDRVITPGVTTLNDVAWFIRTRFEDLGLAPWFHPSVSRQRRGLVYPLDAVFMGESAPDTLIRRGDLIHTDVGLCYLGLCTDTQEMGYVLHLGETTAPAGLVAAMATGNRWQDTLTDAFKTGHTGNEILANAQRELKAQGIQHAIYSHPLGVFGHAPGPTIGMWDNHGPTPVRGDWPLHPMTGYAIEGNVAVRIPEWDNQPVQMKLEQGAIFDGHKVHYLAGRQTELHLVH